MKGRFHQDRLRLKIIAWSFIPTAIILTAVAGVIFIAYQQVTEKLVVEQNRKITELTAARLSAELTNYTTLLREYAGLLADSTRPTYIGADDLDALQGTLTAARGQLEPFDGGVVVINNFGAVIAAEPERPQIMGQNWSDRDYYRQMLRGPDTVFSNIVTDGPDGAEVIVAAAPITGKQGQFLGLIAGMFRLDTTAGGSFYNNMTKLRLGDGGSAFVVDGNGRVLYHTDPGQIGRSFADRETVRRALAGQTDAVRARDRDNREIVAGFAPIPGAPWVLVVEQSWDSLTAGNQKYGTLLLLLLALGVIVPAIVVSIGVRQITQPITQLIAAAQKITEGDYNQIIRLNSGDEIEELADRFNRMSAHLHDTYGRLERELAERRQAEEALRRSEARFRSLFEDVPIALMEQDFSAVKTWFDDLRRQGVEDFAAYFRQQPEAVSHGAKLAQILDANKAALALYQAQSKKEIIDNLDNYFGKEAYTIFKKELIALAAGQTHFETETINRTKTGSQIHILLSLSVAPGHEETLSKVFLSITDITQRKLTQKSLQQFAERLATLHAIDRSILSTQPLANTVQNALDYITPSFSCTRSSVTLFDFENQKARLLAAYTDSGSAITTGDQIPLETFIAINKLRRGEIHITPDLGALSQRPPIMQTLYNEGVRSYMNVPLLAQEELIGSLNLGSRKPNAFTREHQEIALEVANQLAVAIRQDRLYEETRRYAEEMERLVAERTTELQTALSRTESLYHVSRSLLTFHDLPALLQTIAGNVAEALPANRVSLILLDTKEAQVTHLAKGGKGADLIADVSFDELWQGLSGWALREKKPALSRKNAPDPRESAAVQRRRQETGAGSIIVIPLFLGSQALGAITAINRLNEREFTEQDVDLMMALANQTVVAIENARLYEERVQRAAEMTALYELSRALIATLDLKALLPVIAQQITEILGADRCTIFLFDEQENILRARAAYGYMAERLTDFSYRPGEEIVGQAYVTKETQYMPDLNLAPELRRRDEIRAVLAVPMASFPAGVLGVLSVVSLQPEAFTPEQQRLLETMAGQIAAAIENARLYEAAQEADRLKSAFLASMSHELRTPLNSIIGFTGIILQGLAGPLTAEQTKQLNMIRDSARHLLALINDVLDVSKIEAGELQVVLEPMDMRRTIEKVIRAITPLTERKGLALTSDIAPEVGEIVSDQRRVEQILINLINNAIKFTEDGAVSVVCRLEGGYVITQVTDTGIGIKPEDVDKLFQPFRQINMGTARVKEGTGLGLSICRKLVDLLGGDIWVESEWGSGSAFTFTLPLQM